MTEQQIQLICEVVGQLFKDDDVGRLLEPGYFPSLVAEVRESLHGKADSQLPSDRELYCITALCVLGPPGKGAPPLELCSQLTQVTQDYADLLLDHTLEFAVAFGCGKWREIKAGNESWSGPWLRAIHVLAFAMHRPAREANVWISTVTGYTNTTFWTSKEGKEIVDLDAYYLAMHLINPVRTLHLDYDEQIQLQSSIYGAIYRTPAAADDRQVYPAGARLVFSCIEPLNLIKQTDDTAEDSRDLESGTVIDALVRDDDTRVEFEPKMPRLTLKHGETAVITGSADLEQWTCGCGNHECARKHRLEGWTPSEKITLWSFLASAVKGGTKNLVTNAFASGIYYPMLAMDGGASGTRVRMVSVGLHTCSNPECSSPDRPKRYDGGKCPDCRMLFNPKEAKCILDERLIAASDVGGYQIRKMQHCLGKTGSRANEKKCDNYYSFEDSKCPLCGNSPKTKRPTNLWIRNPDLQSTRVGDSGVIDRVPAEEDPFGPDRRLLSDHLILLQTVEEELKKRGFWVDSDAESIEHMGANDRDYLRGIQRGLLELKKELKGRGLFKGAELEIGEDTTAADSCLPREIRRLLLEIKEELEKKGLLGDGDDEEQNDG